MDWVITYIGGSIMAATFLYVAIRMILLPVGKLLCYLERKKVRDGRT